MNSTTTTTQEGLVSFCHTVYQAVLIMTGQKDNLSLKNEVLYEASRLFQGTHKLGKCRDTRRAATTISNNLRTENLHLKL